MVLLFLLVMPLQVRNKPLFERAFDAIVLDPSGGSWSVHDPSDFPSDDSTPNNLRLKKWTKESEHSSCVPNPRA